MLHTLANTDAACAAAAWALGQLGAAAATAQVLTALLHALADTDASVRRAAATGCKGSQVTFALPDRSAMVQLFAPLARSSDAESRDVGYVSLRNLLATEPVSDMSPALAGLQ